ncbi:MAG: hypothetical protein ACXVCV_26225 [Polyangia bacterium]
MRTTSLALALVGAVALVQGCNAAPATRAVTGQLRVDTSTMNHPVVLAQSSDHRVFVADVTASGRFTLQLPANVSYRLTLASSTKTAGIYSAAARINWPLASGAARWATLGNGAAIELGAVFKRGTKSSSTSSSSGGSGDGEHGDCHEDDQAGCQSHDSDVDCDCDHKMGAGDQCDQDDDGDTHEHECDDDDHHKCSGDGGDHEGDHEGPGGGHACDGGGSGGSGGSGGNGGSGGGGGGGGAGGIN